MTDDKKNKEEQAFQQMNQNEKPSFRVIEDGNAVKNKLDTDSIPVYVRPKPLNKKKSWIPPVLLTIGAASVIGTILGMLLLKLFVGMDQEQVVEESNSTPVQAQSRPAPSTVTEQLPALSGHVVQAGLFVEKENAIEWKEHYEATGEPAYIWETEGQYYLFIGIFATEEEARQKVEQLQNDGHDVFVKKWETSSIEVELPEAELDWLKQFHREWGEALTVKEATKLVRLSEVNPSSPEVSNLLEQLTDDTEKIDVYLLTLMNLYDNL